jgi:Ribonuclease H2 non-catalytic subunit (Ylr154p-like)
MLALQHSKQPLDKCSPNVLPCRISYTGPSKVTKRFWSPSLEKGTLHTPRVKSSFVHPCADSALDQTRTAYFRGRRLRGRVVKVPEGYEGTLAICHNCRPPSTHMTLRYHCKFNRPTPSRRACEDPPASSRRIGLGGSGRRTRR